MRRRREGERREKKGGEAVFSFCWGGGDFFFKSLNRARLFLFYVASDSNEYFP